MKIKKICAFLVITVISLCMTAIPVLAEEISAFDLAGKTNGMISVNSTVVNSKTDNAKLTVSLSNIPNLGALQFEVKYDSSLTNVVATNQLGGRASIKVKADGISYAFATGSAITNPNVVLDFTFHSSASATVRIEKVKAWDTDGKLISSLAVNNGKVELISDISGLEIEPNTTVAELKQKIGPSCQVTKNGVVLGDTALVGTGCRVIISNGSSIDVIIMGDVDGTGKVDVADILVIQSHILGTASLVDSYLKAANVNGDGVIDVSDILAIQDKILIE